MTAPKTIYASDYKPYPYQVKRVDISFDLDSTNTLVTTKMNIHQLEQKPLFLNGDEVELVSIKVDDTPVSDYTLDEDGLTFTPSQSDFTLTIQTKINPKENTKLQGLYESDGILCTKCETHGFRRITFFPDRPDVMPIWETTLIADGKKYPKLVSNGNKKSFEKLPNGKIKAVFFDPVPKACYLYAVVAGNLDQLTDKFITKSGRKVELNIFVESGKGSMSGFAVESLKKAMRWDEETFHREYDHDVFNIVAVSNFNSGACENTSLNIFNDKYILADPRLATDTDYLNIEGVVAHEYFHNWSGNRVTLRDWFDLTLKEGFTVYRDQEFSSDMRTRSVKRIEDVISLRNYQFIQDASPLAHPIRPDSYISVRSLYTGTVYDKGAEVIRMMERIVGTEKFKQGVDLYFSRHDGQAVTCHDFVIAISDATKTDLSLFEQTWYHQAGTPTVTATGSYNAHKQAYMLVLNQTTPATPGQDKKTPFVIPLEIALLDKNGNEMVLDATGSTSKVFLMNKATETLVFENIPSSPILSANRQFTAPIYFKMKRSDDEWALLMEHDSDLFNRWDAGQQFATEILCDLTDEFEAKTTELSAPTLFKIDVFCSALKTYLLNNQLDKSFISLAFTLPTEKAIAEHRQIVDVDAISQARKTLRKFIADKLHHELLLTYHQNITDDYQTTTTDIGKRAIKNMALSYLSLNDVKLPKYQYETAKNMSDKFAAVRIFANRDDDEGILNNFYETYKDFSLVVDKWLMLQATANENSLSVVKKLLSHPAFNIKNPNKVRALIGAFATNQTALHKLDGSGYDFIVEQTLAVDKINPQIAATIPVCLGNWKKFDYTHQQLMKNALIKIMETSNLSPNTYEIVSKSLK